MRLRLTFAFLLIPSLASAAAPTLTRLEPSGAARGSTVEVTVVGVLGTWPPKTWVEGKGIAVEALKERGKYKVTVAADATPGPRRFRVYNEEGASSPRPFFVGTLPERNEVEPNDSPKQAQSLDKSAVVVNGKLGQAGDVDVFAVSLKKGETLVASIDSRAAFGSPMDGVLQVVSPQGFVQAQNDDDGGFDPRLDFVAPSDGKYLVRVFAFPATPDSTIRFAGGDGYLYRLTITNGPFLDHPFPLSIRSGTKDVAGSGWSMGKDSAKLPVLATEDPTLGLVSAPSLGNTSTVKIVAANVAIESEPNAADSPKEIVLPASLSGRIDKPRDVDGFRFEAKKGTRLAISVEAKRVGSPLDPTIKVYDPAGKILYEGDDTARGGRDLDATFTPTVDGPHRLAITDLHGRGGERFAYLVTLGSPEADFTLSLAEDRVTIKPGAPSTLKVNINRINGYDKPIEVLVVGPPTGVKAPSVVSAPKGDSSKSVTLKLECDKGPASGPIRVEGVEAEGSKRVRVASSAVTDIPRPLLSGWVTVLPPPPPPKVEEKPKPKTEEKPKPKVEEKPKPKVEEKPKPKVEEKPKPKVEAKPKTAGFAGELKHWAFAPIGRAVPPQGRGRNPIDAFLDVRIEAEGKKKSILADKPTLIRRATLDLLGLSPTPAEVQAFVADNRVDAYERLVDRLLARSEYGERYARHWFDVARYAESNGYERDDAKPGAWRYRDYVINALNADLPFDRFLTEQIAGDELPDATPETRIATTFLRLGTWDDEPADDLVDRYDQLDDVMGTVATAFMGVTLRCARCHDHKFDPFSQVEYYRMLAVFEPLTRPQIGRAEFEWPVCSPKEYTDCRLDFDRRAGRRGAANFGAAAALVGSIQPIPTAYIWKEKGPKPPETRLLKRGDPTKKGEVVPPGVPAALGFPISGEPLPTSFSTGRRLWLARWLAAPENPLAARVIANRLWQWHFGVGLVASSNDFGTTGEAPTHPELLDWLAAELIRGGWRLKPIHKLILTSEAYRRAAGPATEERLLEHFPKRRLEAEVIRDSILSISGGLNPGRHGPGVYPEIPRAVLEGQSRPGEGWGKSSESDASRRSIYVFAKRSLAIPELELLDTPDTTSSCERRPSSTTGPQALTFLNGSFINRQAAKFAERLRREAPDAEVERAFQLVLARSPLPSETNASLAFLKRQRAKVEAEGGKDAGRRALESFCLVMLNLNEFVYLP